MALKFALFCSLAVGVIAAPRRSYSPPSPPSYSPPPSPPRPAYRAPEPVEPANYNFEWVVQDSHSENHFGHQETRDDDNTKGTYYVLLPDGRTQKVTYYVDGDSGFVAEVEYEGQARYDPPAPKKPTYG